MLAGGRVEVLTPEGEQSEDKGWWFELGTGRLVGLLRPPTYLIFVMGNKLQRFSSLNITTYSLNKKFEATMAPWYHGTIMLMEDYIQIACLEVS